MTAGVISADAAAVTNEAAAAAHLPLNPEEALRLLSRWERAPAAKELAEPFARALATKLVAHLLLGDHAAALDTAREMRTSWSPQSLRTASYWLLKYPHDPDPLARLIQGGASCGRPDCRHPATIDLALVAIGRAPTQADRVEIARILAARRPDATPLGLALVRELRAAGKSEEALGVLLSHPNPAVRRLAGPLLYQQGRMADAVALLSADDRLRWFATFTLDADTVSDPAIAVPGDQVAAALWHERAGRWKEAAHAWTAAGLRREAIEASLSGGHVPSTPTAELDPRWSWRRYALTGSDAPTVGPGDDEARRHREIGLARSYLSAVRSSGRAELPATAPDPFGFRPLLMAIVRADEDPTGMRNRILHLRPPQDPWDLLEELPALPSGQPVDGFEERLEAWRRWAAARTADRVGSGSDRTAAAIRTSLARGERVSVDDVLQAVSALTAGERALAVSAIATDEPEDLRRGYELALGPEALAEAVTQAPRETLVCAAAAARNASLTDVERLRAGEIAGSIAAQLAVTGAASDAAARGAAEEVQQSLADVVVPDTALAPAAVFELELGWLRLLWTGKGTIGSPPVIASLMSPPGELGTGRSRAKLARLYGPLGRAWIIFEAGRPQAALRLAETVDGSTPGRKEALATFRASVARQLAEVGRVQESVEALRAAGSEAASAAATVSKAIAERLSDSDLDRAIVLLEQVMTVAPQDAVTKLQLARCLNRRANRRPDGPASLEADIADFQRAAALDPDNPTIRSNLVGSRLVRAASLAERSPERALEELESAMRMAMDTANLRSFGSNVAVRIAATYAERRDRSRMRACLRLALQYDPENEMAQEIWMQVR